VFIALSGCSANGSSRALPARSDSLVATISGLDSSGLVLVVDTTRGLGAASKSPLAQSGSAMVDSRTESVSAGQTTRILPALLPTGSSYRVMIQTQPAGETCSISNGVGTMVAIAAAKVAVTCAANIYTVGGAITGLTASGLVLLDNGGDATAVSANATQFTLHTGVAYGSTYSITVQSQPAGLVCSVSSGTAPMGAADVAGIAIACGSNFSLLHAFAGSGDAADPYHTLIQASDGNFYGSTLAGGGSNGGAIYEIAPNGTESVFYSFATTPWAGLIQGSDGNFYGTTASGGSSGRGTIFKLTLSGVQSVLYSFPGGGSDPYCGLVEGSDGNFYGTTGAGGASDDGTVFKITPNGTESVLHIFAKTGTDGQTPYAGLIQGGDGNFYGTTYFGGSSGFGTVFEVTPAGVESVLYSFAGGSDGEHPYAGVIEGRDGNFYGTTYQGGTNGYGTVFKLTPGGTETSVYSFAGGSSDGANPEAGLTPGSDGNFYGSTYLGGSSNLGTVF
jgi:uncharacterized repeat protein (TIGR03803 family)